MNRDEIVPMEASEEESQNDAADNEHQNPNPTSPLTEYLRGYHRMLVETDHGRRRTREMLDRFLQRQRSTVPVKIEIGKLNTMKFQLACRKERLERETEKTAYIWKKRNLWRRMSREYDLGTPIERRQRQEIKQLENELRDLEPNHPLLRDEARAGPSKETPRLHTYGQRLAERYGIGENDFTDSSDSD